MKLSVVTVRPPVGVAITWWLLSGTVLLTCSVATDTIHARIRIPKSPAVSAQQQFRGATVDRKVAEQVRAAASRYESGAPRAVLTRVKIVKIDVSKTVDVSQRLKRVHWV